MNDYSPYYIHFKIKDVPITLKVEVHIEGYRVFNVLTYTPDHEEDKGENFRNAIQSMGWKIPSNWEGNKVVDCPTGGATDDHDDIYEDILFDLSSYATLYNSDGDIVRINDSRGPTIINHVFMFS